MVRTTISLDDAVHEQAREQDLIVSKVAEEALKQRLEDVRFRFLNGNERNATNPSALVYQQNVVATSASEDDPDAIQTYGGFIKKIDEGDRILHYESGTGARAAGFALANGSAEPVPDGDKVLYEPSEDVVEFHCPVHWETVLPPDLAVSHDVVEAIVGYPVFARGTHTELDRVEDNAEILYELIRQRSRRF